MILFIYLYFIYLFIYMITNSYITVLRTLHQNLYLILDELFWMVYLNSIIFNGIAINLT